MFPLLPFPSLDQSDLALEMDNCDENEPEICEKATTVNISSKGTVAVEYGSVTHTMFITTAMLYKRQTAYF